MNAATPMSGVPGMRRCYFDSTGKVRSTDPVEVGKEVLRLFAGLYPGQAAPQVKRAFRDM
jgi:hypothetical protein